MFVTITVISTNGNIIQLDNTITNDSLLVATQSATPTLQQGVLQQNNLKVSFYVCLWLIWITFNLFLDSTRDTFKINFSRRAPLISKSQTV